jgi:class 3 adenylate cyclase
MVLLGDVGQVEACFGPFGDSVNLDARQVHGLHRMYHGPVNHFGAHPMVLLGDVGQVKAHFEPFGDSVNLSAR